MLEILKELLKYLIEFLKKTKFGGEALLIIVVLALSFAVVQYFETNPKAFAPLYNANLQAFAIFTVSIWAASLCWRYARMRTLRIIVTFIIVLFGTGSAVWVIQSSHIKQFHVQIVFDESVHVTPDAMKKIIDCLQSPLLNIEIKDKAIRVSADTPGTVTDEEVRTALSDNNLIDIQDEENIPLPILIVGDMLSNSEWSNLMMISWNDAVVISTHGVGADGSLSNETTRRYVETSVVIEVLVAKALEQNTNILSDRSSDLYRGCLHDFHRTRETYITQSQQPKLCDAERKSISSIFGDASVKAINDIFSKISQDK